jgi:hypothetical protein
MGIKWRRGESNPCLEQITNYCVYVCVHFVEFSRLTEMKNGRESFHHVSTRSQATVAIQYEA